MSAWEIFGLCMVAVVIISVIALIGLVVWAGIAAYLDGIEDTHD